MNEINQQQRLIRAMLRRRSRMARKPTSKELSIKPKLTYLMKLTERRKKRRGKRNRRAKTKALN